jgi:PrcB C-terminal
VSVRAALVAVLLLSRPCPRNSGGRTPAPQSVPVVMVVAHSGHAGWSDAAAFRYTASVDFAAAWDTLFSIGPRPSVPHVDFSGQSAMIVAAGTEPTGGYRLDFDSASVRRDTLRIGVTLRTPPPGCGVTQELTAPAIALIIPRVPAVVRIVRREAPDTAKCG